MTCKKIKNFLINCKYFYLNVIRYLKSSKKGGGKTVYFDISENFYKRYLHIFAYFFYLNNFQIFFRVRFRFIGDWYWATQEIFKFNPNVRLCLFKKKADISIVDNVSKKDSNSILITPEYFNGSSRTESYHIPMSMYHTNYYNNMYEDKARLALKGNRKIRVLFAGNLENSEYYNDRDFYGKFKITNRLDIINFICKKFKNRIMIPDSYIEYTKMLEMEDQIDILLVDRRKFSIPPDLFLQQLSNMSFFIAAPGVVMPLCHNIIEAMCVGSIPILEYSDSFMPHLEGRVNCISFNGLPDLEKKIDDVLGMDEITISGIRENTVKYYNDYLSPSSVINHIEKNRYNLKKLFLNAEHLSVDLIDK